MEEIKVRLAVIGGGPAGVCAALAAARSGVPTALLTDRPVLGGNSSSEIRVWTRGATGAGNLYAEEMGIWGELKLDNFRRNPDGNSIFWDEALLDAVLKEKNLTLFLNTEVFDAEAEDKRIVSVLGTQQGTEALVRVQAEMFIDATGDGSLGAKIGVPYTMGDINRETLSSTILYYTRREDHPVPFMPPEYAYSLEEIERIIGRGGRVISERMSGSDCWWFEYGGLRDTIKDAQDIALELKRLVMGVWNYVKNSGKFDADCYTLEWLGSIPGKRESRRMRTEYWLTQEDILTGRSFQDGGFYGGWYMDSHPAGGMNEPEEENCVQIPVNVYEVPMRCLYSRDFPNLLFAGRNIGVERDVFFSSRIMNTCALCGQAAGTLAAACLQEGLPPGELPEASVQHLRQKLLREDMFIPGLKNDDPGDLARKSQATASSHLSGAAGKVVGEYSLKDGGFVLFPAKGGGTVRLEIKSEKAGTLKARQYLSMLPNRMRPGKEAGILEWTLEPGVQDIESTVSQSSHGKFCLWEFEPAPGVRVSLCQPKRTGFLCGNAKSPQYFEPVLEYEPDTAEELYGPGEVLSGVSRPWGSPNVWCAGAEDEKPWLELTWQEPVALQKVLLYLDPELCKELPSSRARSWEDSHLFSPRETMPAQLVRRCRFLAENDEGELLPLGMVDDNCHRLVTVELPQPVKTRRLRIEILQTWGDRSAAVYEVRAYGPQ